MTQKNLTRRRAILGRLPGILLAASVLLLSVSGQRASRATEDRVTQAIDVGNTVRLPGNTHPLARAEYDRGAVPAGQTMDRMVLVLAPDAAAQAELDELVEALHNPASPLFHQWITPEEYGRRFGVSQNDLNRIQGWLTGEGFQVEEIPSGKRSIVFSGTAGQVAIAFHTEIHAYSVGSSRSPAAHFANATDPQIPAALAAVVAGVVSLHDFLSQPALASLEAVSNQYAPLYTSGGTHYLAPADLAVIYDINPLYSNSVDGTGASIAVVARSNVKLADVTSFRSAMGLPENNPTIILNGTNPEVITGNEQVEATLDVEWAGALAKKAAVKLVVSASGASDGAVLSAQYIVNDNTAPVMTTSFGVCEADEGTAGTQFWNSLWQQAAAEGITAFVAAGDSGAAGCDSASGSTATQGRGVNAIGSSPYIVTVGGTEFNDAANPGQYWSFGNSSTTSGSPAISSALGYIPEMVWNTSGSVTGGFELWAGGGGASIVFSKPSWQTGNGVPSAAARAVPDVSIAASTHDGFLIGMNGALWVVGGTSASSPSWASLMALVVQHASAAQGNANPNLYSLFRLQSGGGAAVFHDITGGNNSVPGLTGFAAGPGYDQASGIGSPDALLLVQHWGDTSGPALNLSLAASTVSVATGASAQVTVGTTVGGGLSAGVALSVTGLPLGLTAGFAPSTLPPPGAGSSTLTLKAASSATPGNYALTVIATGGGIVQSASLAVTVSVPTFSLSTDPGEATVQVGGTGQVRVIVAPTAGFQSAVTLSAAGLPSGVTAAFSPATLASGAGSSTVILMASASAAPATASVTFTATGGGATQHIVISVTILQPASLTASPASLSVPRAGSGQVVLTVAPASLAAAGVVISVSGLPAGVSVSGSPSTTGLMAVLLNVSTTADIGTHVLTFSATLGGVTKTAAVALTITPPLFTFSEATSALSIARGGSGNVTVTVTPVSGFTSAVALSVGQLPAGVTAAFSPERVSGVGAHAVNLRITAVEASAGPSSITISATGGGAAVSLPLALTIQ